MADQAIRARRGSRTRRKSAVRVNRLLLGGIALMVAVLGGELLYRFALAPTLTVQQVRVRTDLAWDVEEALRRSGLHGEKLIFEVDTAEAQARLEAHAEVQEAAVARSFPDTVEISISARRPLGTIIVEGANGSTPAAFCEEGVVFRTATGVRDRDVPVLSGELLEKLAVGESLPRELRPLVSDLHDLRMEAPALYGMISEIEVRSRAGTGVETILYPAHLPVPVKLEDRASPELYGQVARVLDALARREGAARLDFVDMRDDGVVYTLKEDG